MKVVTTEEMRVIDAKTIEEFGVPGLVLMERAGYAVASRIKDLYSPRKCIVISGSGNNGGDGIVVARDLFNEGWDIKVFLIAGPEVLKGDALSQYHAAINFGVPVHPVQELLIHHSSIFSRHSVIVDAILGTGLSKKITGTLSEVIRLINKSDLPVISVDIPSGISSDNGQVMGEAVKADYTVTFGLPKRGHFLYPGAEFSGRLFVEDIGFPRQLIRPERLNVELLEKNIVSGLIPVRKDYSHKGNYGHVLIVAGSRGKTGAALMAAKACLRAGAGLVTLGVPESLADIFQSSVKEEMVLVLPDKGDGTISAKGSGKILDFLSKKADLLAIGPGIGVTADTERLLRILIENSESPMVIDADGINSIRQYSKVFAKSRMPVILTPHPGEMARLLSKGQRAKSKDIATGLSLRDEIEKDRITASISFAKETGTILVLKGVPTIIAAPDGKAFINSTGNPGMATGGTGDVLTGMISGFLSQTGKPVQASILGVYLQGLAGDIAALEKGRHALIATDIINKIPNAFFALKG